MTTKEELMRSNSDNEKGMIENPLGGLVPPLPKGKGGDFLRALVKYLSTGGKMLPYQVTALIDVASISGWTPEFVYCTVISGSALTVTFTQGVTTSAALQPGAQFPVQKGTLLNGTSTTVILTNRPFNFGYIASARSTPTDWVGNLQEIPVSNGSSAPANGVIHALVSTGATAVAITLTDGTNTETIVTPAASSWAYISFPALSGTTYTLAASGLVLLGGRMMLCPS